MSELSFFQVGFEYPGGRGFRLDSVTLEVPAGAMVAVLGPNGSGKTTLLRLAAGVLRPSAGEVWLAGRPVRGYSRRELARLVAVAPQELHVPFAFTAREIVALGRTPHAPLLGAERPADRAAVERALAAVGLAAKADRLFSQLSGGERRRAVLALALAQESRVLLLDEPTAHLDLAAQLDVLELTVRLNRERGLTVLAAIHDLNLAALYFPRLVLLANGSVVADGPPDEVVRPELVWRVYGAGVQVERHPTRPVPHVVLLPRDGAASTAGARWRDDWRAGEDPRTTLPGSLR